MKLRTILGKSYVLNPIFGIALLLLLVGCNKAKETTEGVNPITVSVQKIAESTGNLIYDYSGNLESDNTVNLSFSVSGRVVAVYVEEGQHVVKGQLLATIEQDRYESAYQVAEANFTMAADNFNRSKELYNRKSLPERDFVVAKANKELAKANKDIAAKDLSDTKLVAPFTGVITNKITEVGNLVTPGNPAFTLNKTDVMYATASIAEGDIAYIKKGDSVAVTIPALQQTRMANITIMNPQGDQYSRTFEVKVKLLNEDGRILPGMLAQLHINTGVEQDVISIPTNCILKDAENIAYVFLAQPNKTALKKRINIESATGLNKVIVSSGIKKGDLLITKGQSKLVDGSAIQF